MTDKEAAKAMLEALNGQVRDQQTERVMKELMMAYSRFKLMKVWKNADEHTIKCPRCGAIQATDKEAGAILYCAECGQCIRLKNSTR